MDFQNRVVVVTGGANGIGRATVESFLTAGAVVAFVDTDKEAGEKIVSRFATKDVYFHQGDIAEEAALHAFAEAVKQRFGKVDYLVNNACISKKGILSECSYQDFNYVLALGVTAPYMLSSLLLPVFTADASVVNIASSRGFMSQEDTESYSAAKGGILALTHALSISLAGKARVNSISPGWIDTGSFHKDEDYQPKYETADLLQHPVGVSACLMTSCRRSVSSAVTQPASSPDRISLSMAGCPADDLPQRPRLDLQSRIQVIDIVESTRKLKSP
jgi:NAD(P)-dependent dehydrogenase (short-subunit alcohol dehydrogenase family)